MRLINSSENTESQILNRFADSLWAQVNPPNAAKALPDAYRLSLIAQAMLAARQLESRSAQKNIDLIHGRFTPITVPTLVLDDIGA